MPPLACDKLKVANRLHLYITHLVKNTRAEYDLLRQLEAALLIHVSPNNYKDSMVILGFHLQLSALRDVMNHIEEEPVIRPRKVEFPQIIIFDYWLLMQADFGRDLAKKILQTWCLFAPYYEGEVGYLFAELLQHL